MFHAGEVVSGQQQALDRADLLRVDWQRADVVLSLEADFLGPAGSPGMQRELAVRRRPEAGPMKERFLKSSVHEVYLIPKYGPAKEYPTFDITIGYFYKTRNSKRFTVT